MLGQPADDGACAVDQLAPEIVVGASSDAAEPWLAASCILPGHQPDPGCHLAARAKLTAIVDAADDRSGNDRPHPRQLCEPPTSLVRAAKGAIIASSFWTRRSRSSSWSMSSPKIARAMSDRSAPAMAVGACAIKRHGPCGSTTPYSARRPRVWLIKAVRW